MSSELAYTALIGLVIAERLVELVLSRRNERRVRARGGVERGAGHFPVMVAIHTLFLIACVTEVWWLRRPFHPGLAALSLAVLGSAMALRYWAIAHLGDRWCTRVLIEPGRPPVASGPYRYLRHPNYLAVVLEIAALPLVHTAWLTAAVFSLLNAAMLTVRIRVENAALGELPQTRSRGSVAAGGGAQS